MIGKMTEDTKNEERIEKKMKNSKDWEGRKNKCQKSEKIVENEKIRNVWKAGITEKTLKTKKKEWRKWQKKNREDREGRKRLKNRKDLKHWKNQKRPRR